MTTPTGRRRQRLEDTQEFTQLRQLTARVNALQAQLEEADAAQRGEMFRLVEKDKAAADAARQQGADRIPNGGRQAAVARVTGYTPQHVANIHAEWAQAAADAAAGISA